MMQRQHYYEKVDRTKLWIGMEEVEEGQMDSNFVAAIGSFLLLPTLKADIGRWHRLLSLVKHTYV